MTEKVKLVIGDETYELKVIEGSEGEKAIDITNLRQMTGMITLDPGFANTGSCASAITFVDGERGILRYRGIPTNMFPVMFAIGRLPGWIAQWKESVDDPMWKLNRPRQIYIGPKETHYIPMDER